MAEECETAANGGDVEEGEISDSASVEEISEEAFNKKLDPSLPASAATTTATSTATGKANSNANVGTDPNQNSNPARVWTMKDLYSNYPVSRDYARGLYNLAWSQAVQNKPLDDIFVMKKTETDDASVKGSNKDEIAVEDGVQEDGELEEGEIDLDMEVVANGYLKEVTSAENVVIGVGEKVNLIREGLQSVTIEDVEKAFDEVCSKLQRLLDGLQEIVSENSLTEKDALVDLFLTAIRTAITVLCSMKQTEKEKHKDSLSRILVGASSKNPNLFSTQQLHEVGKLILSLGLSSVSSKTEDGNKTSDMSVTDVIQDSTLIKCLDSESVSAQVVDRNESNRTAESSRQGVAFSKLRGLSLPLIDLHKDYDADSLPSPTRETQPPLPFDKALSGKHVVEAEFPFPRRPFQTSHSVMHPYETDALKAVSSYQQKFGRSSFFMADRLPSPTPSEDGDKDDADVGEEISSSIAKSCNSLNAFVPTQLVSSVPNMRVHGRQECSSVSTIAPSICSIAAPVSRSSAKIRDPRLRVLNNDEAAKMLNQYTLLMSKSENRPADCGEMAGSRKQRADDEPGFGGPAIKKQRSEQTDSVIVSDIPSHSGTGGWFGGRGNGFPVINSNHVSKSMKDVSKSEQVTTPVTLHATEPSARMNAIENLPATTTSIAATLQSLLSDIAVNPSVWMNRIKMEQLKSIEPSKITAQPESSSNNSTGGFLPMNTAPLKSSATDPRQGGILQALPQVSTPKDDLGKIRMKPRDPRRILHDPSIQKGGNVSFYQTSTSTPNTQEISGGGLSLKSQDEQLDKKLVFPNHSAPPDISQLFTKNLKNIADIISVSQPSISSSLASQTSTLQPTRVHQGKLEGKGVILESSQPLASGVASIIHSPQSSWGDVEHLFEGFDDQQKAAIQRERERRIAEQKKMFAARKLSLVLDLDHTLLNSAKFLEVDPVHDEILRKKEEQEREKPQRHLFRFPHMAMWTKLRPGIWNFLEKASKLFELHLYTMGNKLYATEMAKILDPKGDMFAGRVVSRGDDADLCDGDEKVPKSKDLEGVLGMESSVVIIDDSVRVWPHNKLNLIVVERYIYFPCSRRQFGLPGPSLLEIDHDERPEAGTLASSLAVIEKIHQMFFEHPTLDEADVRNILATEQRRILSGCRIVFSRVFPVGEANPHLHPLWQTAEQFGAVCTNQIDEKVTHVVANSPGTDKVNWAFATGRFVVHPGWVEASALLYRRANEHDFAIKP